MGAFVMGPRSKSISSGDSHISPPDGKGSRLTIGASSNTELSGLPPPKQTAMGKASRSQSCFPRRAFEMTVHFRLDSEGPQLVTFPFSERTATDLDLEADSDTNIQPSATPIPSPTTSTHDNLVPEGGILKSSENGEVDADGARGGHADAGGDSDAGGGEGGEAGSTQEGLEEDEDVENPFTPSRLRSRSFYGRRGSYYYYQWSTKTDILEPPVHPTDLSIDTNTMFFHWNTVTRRGKAWIWGSGTESPTGIEGWLPLKEREQREFPHSSGKYYFLSCSGAPRWVKWSTLRQLQYRESSPGTPFSTSSASRSTTSRTLPMSQHRSRSRTPVARHMDPPVPSTSKVSLADDISSSTNYQSISSVSSSTVPSTIR